MVAQEYSAYLATRCQCTPCFVNTSRLTSRHVVCDCDDCRPLFYIALRCPIVVGLWKWIIVDATCLWAFIDFRWNSFSMEKLEQLLHIDKLYKVGMNLNKPPRPPVQ